MLENPAFSLVENIFQKYQLYQQLYQNQQLS